jgi:PAS domain S-box-containing protein
MERPIANNQEVEVTPVDIVVSKTDIEGNIEYANQIFFKLSGYNKKELTYEPHSILRHPDMPKIVFKHLWSELKKGNEVYAFVKNLTKNGSFYWVLAYVRPTLNPDGSLRNYVSTRKTMSSTARAFIEPLYAELLEIEKNSGVDASERVLMERLAGREFNQFMIDLNRE